MEPDELKALVKAKAAELGAALVRTCPTDRWSEQPIQDEAYWPRSIWPWAENAVVLGIPLFVPMVATTPSMVYQELYNTSNRILDDIAYRMTSWLTSMGYRSAYFPRDCYFSVEALLDNHSAAFSHVLAAYYSGMGTIGDSHNLLTPEFGPRVRMVTVLTDADIAPDPMIERQLCIHCGRCLRKCPSSAFSEDGGGMYRMDWDACTMHHLELKRQRHWPCGICVDVCPVGEDLERYGGSDIVSPSGKTHCAEHGS